MCVCVCHIAAVSSCYGYTEISVERFWNEGDGGKTQRVGENPVTVSFC
jgi:hypothetical protein